MAREIRRVGRALIVVLPFVVLAFLLLAPPSDVSGATYVDPFWSNTSSDPECACTFCPCDGPPEWSPEGVNVRTGELVWDHHLFRVPGLVTDNVFSIRWRSTIDGRTQLGNGILPSWEITVEKEILNPGNPDASGGHEVYIRRPSGRVDVFGWDGSEYSPDSCNVLDELTTNVSGDYVLTDPWGNAWAFNEDGMPDTYTDRNGNEDTYTYNASLQLTAIEDDRGGSYTIDHDQDGFIESITDPASREWTFTYDTNGNLETITTPATADQTNGITTTLDYDGYNRLTSVEDGRENTILEITYDAATAYVDTVEIDGDEVSFEYYTGRTERTDRLGTVHRYHYTGKNVTQTDLWIDNQAEYVNLFRYNGNVLINRVYPEGNRVDYTRDSSLNLTERRHRVADTSMDADSDLVHTWTYSGPAPTSYTDPEGNKRTYGYDSDYNRTSVTHPAVTNPENQSASTSTTYNSSGQVLSHSNEEGLLTTYVYFTSGTSEGLLQKIQVGPLNSELETSFTYDSAGNVATRTDPEGNAWTYTWDNLRRMTQAQAPSPLSYKTKYEYDANGNRTKREIENRDKDGDLVTANSWFTTTWTYTNLNRVATITEEIDASTTRTTSLYYDENGNRTRVVKPLLNEDRWTYDERGLVLTHVRGYGSDDASTTEYEYDDSGRLVTVTDGRDNDTDHTYDAFGRRTMTTDALGHYTKWTYDKNGSVTKVARYASDDTLLLRSTRYFDERGRHWKTSDLRKDPGQTYSDAVTTFERLKTGQVAEVTNARGKITTYTFDTYLRVETVTDAEDNQTTYTRDDNGNVTAWSVEETDGTNIVTHEYEATYDELNRRLTTVAIDRTDSQNEYTTTSAYDSRSNRVWLVNAEGNPTRWTYDGLGRMTKRERALTLGQTIEDFSTAQVTEWEFDKDDRLVGHTDDGSNESTWAYDALDRPTSMTYPDDSSASYEYDASDNVTKVTDPAGNVITDTYDALNRNTSRSITRAQGFVGTTSETRTYDGAGRLLTTEDNDYKVTFTHAVTGMRSHVYTEVQEYVGGTAYKKTVTRTYDEVGNKATETYPSGLSLDYTYNDINLLTEIDDGANSIVEYTYWGTRLKGATFGNSATQSNTYGGFRQDLTSVDHQTSTSSTVVRLDYGYNKVHDRTYERFGASGSSGDAFEYDKMRRLTTAWMGSATPSSPSGAAYTKKIVYNMDDDGNRTSVVVTPYQQSATTTSYTTNSLNQYTNVGGTTHSWDGNGSLVDDGTLLFEYDYKNLPVYVRLKADNSLVATYKYDALGRRVEKAVSGGSTERYIYSGLETVSTCGGQTTWKQDFVYAQGIDRIVMLEQADVLDYDGDQNTTELTRNYYHRNALGSVMEITDANEATVVSYRYDPYGAITITRGGQTQGTDPLGQHWTFTSRLYDEETSLHYYRARAYGGGAGRFLQRDPHGVSVGPCLYEYAVSSPSCKNDPLGLDVRTPTGRGFPDKTPPQQKDHETRNKANPGGKGLPLEGGYSTPGCGGALVRYGNMGDGFWIGVQGNTGVRYVFQQWVRIRQWWIAPDGAEVPAVPSGDVRSSTGAPDEENQGWTEDDGDMRDDDDDGWYPWQAGDPGTGSALMSDNPLEEVKDAASAREYAMTGFYYPSEFQPIGVKTQLDLRGMILAVSDSGTRVIAVWARTTIVEALWAGEGAPSFSKTHMGGAIGFGSGAPVQ